MSNLSLPKDKIRVVLFENIHESAIEYFNSRGYNLIPHFVSGIDASAKDENYHSIASANLFRQCKFERTAAGTMTAAEVEELNAKIYHMARTVADHERLIIKKLFEVPGNRVVNEPELIHFMEDRIDVVLGRLELAPLYGHEKGEISKWFYQQLSTVKVPDFFASTQIQYTRNWAKHRLTFRKELAHGV